jgi:hypothetical protein
VLRSVVELTALQAYFAAGHEADFEAWANGRFLAPAFVENLIEPVGVGCLSGCQLPARLLLTLSVKRQMSMAP